MDLPAYIKPIVWKPLSAATLSLSITGTICIMLISLRSGLYKRGLGGLALITIVSDFFYCFFKLATIIPYPKSELLCIALQAITGVGRLSSLTATTCFGHALYVMVRENDTNAIKKYSKFYSAIIFGFPTILELLKVFNYIFRIDSEGLCTVYIEDNVFLWRGVAVGFPTALLCILSFTYYLWACIKMYQQGIRLKQVLAMLLFPAIVIVGWFPSRIIDILLCFGAQPPKITGDIAGQIAHLVGFAQSIAYGFSRSTRKELKAMFPKIKCLGRRGDKEEQLLEDDLTEEEEDSLRKSLEKRKAQNSFRSQDSDKAYL